jgi:NAD(P)-dependent dehydrogenase (short-subunit alcohol dehydrogenase family)
MSRSHRLSGQRDEEGRMAQDLDRGHRQIPVGRLGDVDKIARVVEFLAEHDSAFITGRIYFVNGGQYM